jgi:hypothetical protein
VGPDLDGENKSRYPNQMMERVIRNLAPLPGIIPRMRRVDSVQGAR